MPELHSLMPLLGMLQNQGRRVALVTDGRLSGASGKVLSAIHLTPEAALGGGIARVREGDRVLLDCDAGRLDVLLSAQEWAARRPAPDTAPAGHDVGRMLFASSRALVGPADEGALSISCGPPPGPADASQRRTETEYDLGRVDAHTPFESKDA